MAIFLLPSFVLHCHDIAHGLTVVCSVRDTTAVKGAVRDEQHFLATDEQTVLNKHRDEAFCPIVLSEFGRVLHVCFTLGISPLIHKVRRSLSCN